MFTMDVAAGQTFIQAGESCINIVIILSGKASGVEWPMHGHSYPFKDFGPGDFLGEIESFAGMRQYRGQRGCADELPGSGHTGVFVIWNGCI